MQMEVGFFINARIRVTSNPNVIEVTFDKEEVGKNKAFLKTKVGEIVPSHWAHHSDFQSLLKDIKNSLTDCGLTKADIYMESSPEGVLKRLCKAPYLARIFDMPQPTWEGFPLREHALGVAHSLTTISKSQGDKLKLLRLIALIEDLGKPIAAHFAGDAKAGRKNQHSYNLSMVEAILSTLGFDHSEIIYAQTLVKMHLVPYYYVIGELDENNVIEKLKESVDEQGNKVTILEALEDLRCFWIADGSNYSAVACLMQGLPLKPSFCDQYVFVFSIIDSKWQLQDIRPKASWQSKLDALVKKLGGE
ncbi:MAG: HDOD domain-containing protein [Pseudomonadales bacterium]|jgi:hypothetical protein|nr:HDOD domain-containing protein [Pseudomonadales bacterium]